MVVRGRRRHCVARAVSAWVAWRRHSIVVAAAVTVLQPAGLPQPALIASLLEWVECGLQECSV